MRYWHRFVPPWPPVPRLLWPAVTGAALAVLNRTFYHEIWSGTAPDDLAWLAGWLSGLLVGAQLLWLLWCWPAPAAAPGWWQVLFVLHIRLLAVFATTAWLLVMLVAGIMLTSWLNYR